MTCEHLRPLEQAIIASGIREAFRGQAWQKSREWVYFDCFIDAAAVRRAFAFPTCVAEHSHRGTHDGQERGFVCEECLAGVMGHYEPTAGAPTFRG